MHEEVHTEGRKTLKAEGNQYEKGNEVAGGLCTPLYYLQDYHNWYYHPQGV
jgi:hypothetical protein